MKVMTQEWKYPRTPHLPWSSGTDDDRHLKSVDHFVDEWVVVTEKMDGENTTMTRDRCYARSLDTARHPSRSWVRRLWASVAPILPIGWRVCGENLYAVHSIRYTDLPSYFLVFSVWNDKLCLSWEMTREWTYSLKLRTVPFLYEGPWVESEIKRAYETVIKCGGEGIVVRIANSFEYTAFDRFVAKWVRPHHVQTDEHWLSKPVERNELA